MLNDSIRVFLAVAEKRNFSKAAKSLFLTQPAVSFQIQMLEQYYGTVLFDRVNRNITLTAAGELLLKYAQQMSNLQAELEKEMQELTGTIKGRLLIGASTTIGEYILPYLVGSFKKEFPEVDVSLEVANTEEIEKHILDTSLDVGLVEGPVNGRDLVIEKFLDDELVLITPVDHPWVKNKKISVFELSKYPFITREKGSGTRQIMESALKKAGFDPHNLNIIMELGSTTAIKAAVSNGLGVSIISKWAAKEMVKLNKLATITINETEFERQFTVIYHEKKFRTQAVHEFLNYLKSEAVHNILKK
ncbi:MAG: LysR family transcriptional regulator, transcriptional activator of the cysJI operon [Clostridia bacterium]|jgi:DNA-binding transcriptional LysR family regulator|nr:LysR family transcriptional regulator, transcriptional activator of the cysJI operon [Clostridia bacterium]MDN5322276.1 LysR family transcriptional regulator, transcriptional activator of the cysJI operon [Clostridia bacterium]